MQSFGAAEARIYKGHLAENVFSKDKSTRVLLIGTGPAAVRKAAEIRQSTDRCIVGAIDAGDQSALADECPDIQWLGTVDHLSDIVRQQRINELHVTLAFEQSLKYAVELRAVSKNFGIPVLFYLDGADDRLTVSHDSTSNEVELCFIRHRSAEARLRVAKRCVDFVSAGLCLLLLSPLFLLVAIAIKCTSRGPVFFKQPRVGIGRRIFHMYKFRTMVENAEELRSQVESLNSARGISFKIIKDPRLTVIGQFLRRTSIDETPQLLNILLGEMSMVGPRPIPVWVAAQLRDTRWFRRFMVLPGLTGMWQVEGRDQDFELMASKDLRYIDEWSMALDFKILAATIPAVLKGVNAH